MHTDVKEEPESEEEYSLVSRRNTLKIEYWGRAIDETVKKSKRSTFSIILIIASVKKRK